MQVKTDDMRLERKCLWIGDILEACSEAAPRINDIQIIKPVLRILCALYVPGGQPLAFRRATRSESTLSRFFSPFRFHRSLRKVRRACHMVILTKYHDRTAQIMLSASPNHLSWVECLDIDRVRHIRFLLWVGSQLQCQLALSDLFMSVWANTVIPVCHENKNSFRRVRNGPWILQSISTANDGVR